jgi:hypothetical protein
MVNMVLILKTAVENFIDELVETFLERPYTFYSENDLHCYLYHLMLMKEELSKPIKVTTSKGREVKSILVHKEYPTKGLYRRYNVKDSEITKDLCSIYTSWTVSTFSFYYIT